MRKEVGSELFPEKKIWTFFLIEIHFCAIFFVHDLYNMSLYYYLFLFQEGICGWVFDFKIFFIDVTRWI